VESNHSVTGFKSYWHNTNPAQNLVGYLGNDPSEPVTTVLQTGLPP